MKMNLLVCSAALVAAIGCNDPATPQQAPQSVTQQRGPIELIPSPKSRELQSSLRKLWEDYITWTRLYLVSSEYSRL